MALDDADRQAIQQIVADAIAANAANKSGDGKNGDGDGKGGDGDGQLSPEQIKAAATAAKESESALRSAMAFNLSCDKFLKDNERLLPETINTILTAYKSRQYNGDIEQANNYRKVILDEIFAEQKNIDIMPESAKARILAYKGLAESDKLDKTSAFYDLVDTFLTIKKGTIQAAFNKTAVDTDEYSERFKKLGEKYTNKKGV